MAKSNLKSQFNDLLIKYKCKKQPLFFNMGFYIFLSLSCYLFFLYTLTENSFLLQLLGASMTGIGIYIITVPFHYYGHTNTYKLRFFITCIVTSFSGLTWKHSHNIKHHNYTNELGKDGDIEYMSIIYNISKKINFIPVNFIIPVLFCLMSLNNYIMRDLRNCLRVKKPGYVLECISVKLIHLFVFFVIPYMIVNNFAVSLILFLLIHIQGSAIGAFVFSLAHVGTQQKMFTSQKKSSFVVNQLNTTANFSGDNLFVTWFTGGLNHQIEHHLYPKLHPYDLHFISRSVKDLCSKNKLNYLEHKTAWIALGDLFAFYKNLKNDPHLHKILIPNN